ncbi:MAG: DUF5615 family PIN-like protein [Verrucomicrobia bacterium]|nr:DUF5615 family PIN-like protein [Verrucomicrobiota bacterium]
MKFILDAHLPPSLCAILQAAGHDALHTSELPGGNQTPDFELNNLALAQNRVLISKDTDFYYSHLLQARPAKLVLVRTGNLRLRDLKRLFAARLPDIVQALATHSLVELGRQDVHGIV